ncbi:MAG: helix-hairpin-helix domain-containing protein [Solirubrobacterales bacterium]
MGRTTTAQMAVYAAAAIAIALVGVRYLAQVRERPPRQSAAKPVRVHRSSAGAHVYVTGAVRRPGVYELPAWARLDAAVRRAGGPARGADLEAVNLAAKVADGQQVVVPRRATAGADVATGEALGSGTASGPISLNTATSEQLDQLDGVGPATAQKILDWRKQHGGFRSIEDLKQIGGIGPKRFEALKDKVRM